MNREPLLRFYDADSLREQSRFCRTACMSVAD